MREGIQHSQLPARWLVNGGRGWWMVRNNVRIQVLHRPPSAVRHSLPSAEPTGDALGHFALRCRADVDPDVAALETVLLVIPRPH